MVKVHLEPPRGIRCLDYDLDAVVVEHHEDTGFAFRLQLGQSYFIYWALPAGPGDRMQLALVDCAVAHVDEPTLEADPFVFDLQRLSWDGLLAHIPGGAIVRVTVEASASPASYRCEIAVRDEAGQIETTVLAWNGPVEAA
jgi:hypothetical protein